MSARQIQFHDQSQELEQSSMEAEILTGFRFSPKYSSPKFLYDQRGSELFDKICEQPEYYPTRTEEGILARAVPEIAELAGEGATLVEFGSGASRKVRLLLESMSIRQYLGIDISREFLIESTRQLAADYPWLDVHAACADFSRAMSLPAVIKPNRLVGFFPGSSIGNFTPEAAGQFLRQLHQLMPRGSGLLIGVDLVKDRGCLEAAYNDKAGITAEFNLNLLVRLRRELGMEIEPERFAHRALFNEEQSRIEMHLESRIDQVFSFAGESFRFRKGETLHTENSYKYTVAGFQELAARSGFVSRQVWLDDAQLFSVHYLQAEPRDS